nr:hypothetical protein [Thiomonas sp.]
MILISNDGAEIESTNYWDTEHGRSGLCFLSGNAGAWRLLVPQAVEKLLPEMQTGRSVTIEKSIFGQRAWDIVFEDGTPAPFALTLDKRMTDRAMESGRCRMSVWTRNGKVLDLPCRIKL